MFTFGRHFPIWCSTWMYIVKRATAIFNFGLRPNFITSIFTKFTVATTAQNFKIFSIYHGFLYGVFSCNRLN